jgi:YfiR/HmsC-like
MKPLSCTQRLIATLLALLGLGVTPPAQALEEGELKAAIIFNILLFVQWPAEAKPESGGPLGFCVSTDSSMHAALKALNDRPIGGHRFEVRDSIPADAKACHAAFVDAADSQRNAAGVKALRAGGVLVFSDDAEASSDSTAVVLQRIGNKIAFDVNLQAVRQARLQVSSKLLRLARVVRE